MATEFALAVASGLVVALVSSFLQHRSQSTESTLEITRRIEVIIQSNTFVDGTIVQQDTEAYIEQSTFRLPQSRSAVYDPRLPLVAGAIIFAVAMTILLLL